MTLAVFVHDGEQIDYTPSADLAAGDVVVQGDLVGVARTPIPAGVKGSLAVAGVFDLPKAGAAEFAAGAKVYWDAAGKLAVPSAGEGGANKYVGKAVAAAGSGKTVVRVRLSQ